MRINPESIANSRPKKTQPNHAKNLKNKAQNASNIHAKSHHILQRPPGASQKCRRGVPGVLRGAPGGTDQEAAMVGKCGFDPLDPENPGSVYI